MVFEDGILLQLSWSLLEQVYQLTACVIPIMVNYSPTRGEPRLMERGDVNWIEGDETKEEVAASMKKSLNCNHMLVCNFRQRGSDSKILNFNISFKNSISNFLSCLPYMMLDWLILFCKGGYDSDSKLCHYARQNAFNSTTIN